MNCTCNLQVALFHPDRNLFRRELVDIQADGPHSLAASNLGQSSPGLLQQSEAWVEQGLSGWGEKVWGCVPRPGGTAQAPAGPSEVTHVREWGWSEFLAENEARRDPISKGIPPHTPAKLRGGENQVTATHGLQIVRRGEKGRLFEERTALSALWQKI